MKRLLLLILFPYTPSSASTSISPVLLKTTPSRKIASLELCNSNPQEVNFQIDVCDWDDSHIDKIGTPDPNWIISPKIITIPAKGKQIIRLTQRTASAHTPEAKKRVHVREISTQSTRGGIKIKNNYSIPLFVDSVQPDLSKEPHIKTNGNNLTITNDSNTFITLGRIYNDKESVVAGGYIPASESKTIKLPFDMSHGPYKLDYQIDDTSKTISF